MTTKEKIEKKVSKHKRGNLLSKYIGLIFMTIVFGFLFLFWQAISYEMIDSIPAEYVYVEHGDNQVQVVLNSVSNDMSQWIYDKYAYLESLDTPIGGFVMVLSSILGSAFFIYFFFVPMFGSTDRWFYDEFTLRFSVMGKPTTVNGEESRTIIKGLRIVSKIEDLGDKYKFKASTYNLIGVPGTEEYEVEKWKVTEKSKKWIWF